MARKPKEASEGVKHARALEEALAYHDAHFDGEGEQNYPFRAHIETVIGRLQNK